MNALRLECRLRVLISRGFSTLVSLFERVLVAVRISQYPSFAHVDEIIVEPVSQGQKSTLTEIKARLT